ncbi:MAG TPA: glycosyltransferase family 4 protein [Limnobacter sp.]|nr:glycosyltransferase family 4 protein [Limnobacter sp.]
MTHSTIAYLINQYPKVSHTFIRREILALESLGVKIVRLSVRGWDNPLPDPVDEDERGKTRYLLRQGLPGLLGAALKTFVTRPGAFCRALCAALHMGRRADRAWPYHVIYFLEACKALWILKADGVEHVHAHFGANSAEVAMLIRLLGGPSYSFTVHGPEEFDKPEFIHLSSKIRHSAFVVAITSYCRSQLFRWLPHAQWHKVKEVHCGIDPDFYSDLPAGFPTRPRLVCVGRLCEQKGQLILMQAAAMLRDQGMAFELALAGDGEMRDAIEAHIATLGLQGHVRITGWISSAQVREELLEAQALVLPSFAEGLPVVVMEAMALQRPVISTYIAGIPELVEHGKSGWLCPAGDVAALARNMAACLKSPVEVLRTMGQHAQVAALRQHDSIQEARKLAKLFEHHTQQEPSGPGGESC